ncbi:MAG TPA: AAA family ATPase [Acidimicrobiales bacterium]
MTSQAGFPFSAVVGLAEARLALLLAAIDPGIGGVLLRGDKGSAKSTLARGLAGLLPGGAPFVELPLGATEDRVVGTLDIKVALTEGETVFRPGLLAAAHGGVLYVDEVNLLPDHLVDVLLDVAASGVNQVERDGVSHAHPARFVLVGSMNPEEGELRPQLLDRFGLSVEIKAPTDPLQRAEVVRRRLTHDAGGRVGAPEGDILLRARLAASMPADLPDTVVDFACRLAVGVGAEGLRADLVLCRAAAAFAGWEGRSVATTADVERVASVALGHRRRRRPFDPPTLSGEELQVALDSARRSFADAYRRGEPEPAAATADGRGQPRGGAGRHDGGIVDGDRGDRVPAGDRSRPAADEPEAGGAEDHPPWRSDRAADEPWSAGRGAERAPWPGASTPEPSGGAAPGGPWATAGNAPGGPWAAPGPTGDPAGGAGDTGGAAPGGPWATGTSSGEERVGPWATAGHAPGRPWARAGTTDEGPGAAGEAPDGWGATGADADRPGDEGGDGTPHTSWDPAPDPDTIDDAEADAGGSRSGDVFGSGHGDDEGAGDRARAEPADRVETIDLTETTGQAETVDLVETTDTAKTTDRTHAGDAVPASGADLSDDDGGDDPGDRGDDPGGDGPGDGGPGDGDPGDGGGRPSEGGGERGGGGDHPGGDDPHGDDPGGGPGDDSGGGDAPGPRLASGWPTDDPGDDPGDDPPASEAGTWLPGGGPVVDAPPPATERTDAPPRAEPPSPGRGPDAPATARADHGHVAVAAPARGRVVGHQASGDGQGGGVALAATVRAAARRRQADPGGPIVTADDVRAPLRSRTMGRTVVVVVDASGSVGTHRRVEAATGAVLGLLSDAYLRRDRVALVTFRGDAAEVALPPTASVELARTRLAELPTGGVTPLAEGLSAGLSLARRATADGWPPLLVVITDGRATGDQRAPERARAAATEIAAAGLDVLVVDAEGGGDRVGSAAELATAMGARLLRLDEMSPAGVESAVRAALG